MSVLPRGRCPVCGHDVAVRNNGAVREHQVRVPQGLLLTRVEIAKGLSSSSMRNHAYRAFKENEARRPGVGPAEDVPINDKDAAWDWWIGDLIRKRANTKSFSVCSHDGSSAHGKRQDQKVYTVNRDHPPHVEVDVTIRRSVPWTPEIGQTGARLAAGMDFLKRAGAILESPKLPTAEVVKEVLKAGIKAIKVSGMGEVP